MVNANQIRQILSQKRKQKGLSAKKLGELVGVDKTTIYRYEKGQIEKMPFTVLNKLANELDINPEFIAGFSNNPESSQNNISKIYNKLEPPRQKIVYETAEDQLEEQEKESAIQDNIAEFPKKVVNGRSTAAGNPIDGATEDNNASTTVVDQMDIPSGADEIVTIAGDSMEPILEKGSQVFVHWQPEVEQGEIAIVAIQDEGVTCKKVYYDWNEGEVTLRSINDKYEDRIFSMDEVRVIGKVL